MTPSQQERRSKKDNIRRHNRVLHALSMLEEAKINPPIDEIEKGFQRICLNPTYCRKKTYGGGLKSLDVENEGWKKILSHEHTYRTLVDVGRYMPCLI